MEIKFELLPRTEIKNIIPLLQVLDEKLSHELLEERLNEMFNRGYICLGVFDKNRLIGISGLWILTKYYVGRHIEPDDVVILPEYRGQGVGEKLMDWIYQFAKEQGCIASELNCYVGNSAGQKFWANEGYRIIGFHYQKKF
ncbi:MAG: GNAT family N-acetyltransferase [Sphingobacteriales bacterium]|nr:GNAT family N-acetyltransferase [Sphingobacteriales bacterium]MBI3717348.1 GNAT family N-acetyltransferase [Sphingobacteriales bacterium]